jgi:hypothetical protein
MELENFQLQEKLTQATNQSMTKPPQPLSQTLLGLDSYKTPSVSKQQNKLVLEEDGIQCFDLEKENNFLGDNDLLGRLSVGPLPLGTLGTNSGTGGDELRMFQELERVKRDNELLQLQVEKAERDKMLADTKKGNNRWFNLIICRKLYRIKGRARDTERRDSSERGRTE